MCKHTNTDIINNSTILLSWKYPSQIKDTEGVQCIGPITGLNLSQRFETMDLQY